MAYVTSYDTGTKPFVHDKNRGKWESPKDFLFACVGHAFKIDVVMALPMRIFEVFGVFALIPYFVILAICVVPIIFIQSFLGQFSSTGYISVFRISPVFKGIGYASLAINFVALIYSGVFSVIPVLFFVNSFRPTIPWSCEGVSQWMNASQSTCKNASVDYFRYQMSLRKFGTGREIHFSSQLIFYTLVVWGLVAFILLQPTKLIGRFVRYSFFVIVALMGVCFMRFVFLPGAFDKLVKFFLPLIDGTEIMRHNEDYLFFVPILALSTIGPGWGSVLTMASFNDFKRNVFKNSWLMSMLHLGVIIGMGLLTIFLRNSIDPHKTGRRSSYDLPEWTDFLKLPTALTFLELPNLWSVLFFGMLILGSLNLLIIQLFSLLTSVFDEFEVLREFRKPLTLAFVGILMLTSSLFCSNHGIYFVEVLSKLSLLAQMLLNLLLLLVVLWIYGRERFQRDLNFMTSEVYATWMVYVGRFVAPAVIAVGFLFGLLWTAFSATFHSDAPEYAFDTVMIGILMYLLPWCMIPVCGIYKLKQITGNIWTRLNKCVRPTDWYPADPVDKQAYEERFSCTNISHPLTNVMEDN